MLDYRRLSAVVQTPNIIGRATGELVNGLVGDAFEIEVGAESIVGGNRHCSGGKGEN